LVLDFILNKTLGPTNRAAELAELDATKRNIMIC
jgi:hypothetical protein